MFNFLVGLAIGWLAGSWYANGNKGPALPVDQLRRKASPALEESERLVEESKRELQAAVSGEGDRRARRSRRSGKKTEND